MIGDKTMAFRLNWGAVGIVGVIAFLIGWYFLGLLVAVILAIVIVVLMSVMRIGWKRPEPKK
jgi:Flp pilus assembly protein TadB